MSRAAAPRPWVRHGPSRSQSWARRCPTVASSLAPRAMRCLTGDSSLAWARQCRPTQWSSLATPFHADDDPIQFPKPIIEPLLSLSSRVHPKLAHPLQYTSHARGATEQFRHGCRIARTPVSRVGTKRARDTVHPLPLLRETKPLERVARVPLVPHLMRSCRNCSSPSVGIAGARTVLRIATQGRGSERLLWLLASAALAVRVVGLPVAAQREEPK